MTMMVKKATKRQAKLKACLVGPSGSGKTYTAITDARLHVVCTMRSKTETAPERDEATNKTVIRKLGTKAVQRDGLEYEFTLFCQMELDNTLTVEKTRCGAVKGAVVRSPTGSFLQPVIAWLNSGAPDLSLGQAPTPAPAGPAEASAPVRETPAPASVPATAQPSTGERKPASNGLTLDGLKRRAIQTGWIKGSSREDYKTAWDVRIGEIFGGGMMEDELLPEDYALVNFEIEKHAAEAQGVEVSVPGRK